MTQTLPTQPTAEQRLYALPTKTAQPLRQLLAAGQISDDHLHHILNAGEIARDPGKLLGFAAGYLFMRSQNVPVHDVIAMARAQNRHINLAWSPSRWKDEHERLSRAQALAKLAAESVAYDVSTFAQHLPQRFPGYLISSSRRLGMEGLRQRHCVAAYHDRIKTGACAIAAVFIDKQRWTVQLELTTNDEAPLRIAQIKTRYNGLPSPEIRQRIHKLLGIALPKAPSTATATQQSYLYMENLRRLLPILRASNVESVCVSFDGSGDSGSIEDIQYIPITAEPALNALAVECLRTERFFDDGNWTTRVNPVQSSVDDAITALTDDYLIEADVNWYDGDGGYGSLEIDVAAGTVELNIYTRYTQSENEFYACRDIETGTHLDA